MLHTHSTTAFFALTVDQCLIFGKRSPILIVQPKMNSVDGDAGDASFPEGRRHSVVNVANGNQFWIVRHYMFIMVLASMSNAISETPLLLLYETAICKAYYVVNDPAAIGPGGYIPEAKCKLDPIQADLAMIHASQKQFNVIASKNTSSTI
jgi:hypothetical protein